MITLRVALLSSGMMSTRTASIVAVVLLSSYFGFDSAIAAVRGLEEAPPLSGIINNRHRGVSTSGKRLSGEHHGRRTRKNVINRNDRGGLASKRNRRPGCFLAGRNKIERKTQPRLETQDAARTATAATQTTVTSTTDAASTTVTITTANSRIAFFPGGGRGCSRSVPYLVTPNDGGNPPASGASSAFVVNRAGVVATEIRGGGPGGHPWFTGYSDTEEEEESEYETEEDSEEESQENSETRGEAGEFGADGERSFSLARS